MFGRWQICVVAMLSMGAYAQVNKCTINGAVVYQQAPCTAGSQVVGNAPWDRERAREEEEKRKSDEFRQRTQENYQRKISVARSCMETAGMCEVERIQGMLIGLAQADLKSALGPPDAEQRLGSDELWYYSLALKEASGKVGRHRVQLTFTYNGGPVVGKPGWFVHKVNVY